MGGFVCLSVVMSPPIHNYSKTNEGILMTIFMWIGPDQKKEGIKIWKKIRIILWMQKQILNFQQCYF